MKCDGVRSDGGDCEAEATFWVGPVVQGTAANRKWACSNHLIQIIRVFMSYDSPVDFRIWQRQ